MDGSSPDLLRQLAGLLDGTIDLDQFQRWLASAEASIELHGTDADVDLLNAVLNLFAEYTGGHISARLLFDALREEATRYAPVSVAS